MNIRRNAGSIATILLWSVTAICAEGFYEYYPSNKLLIDSHSGLIEGKVLMARNKNVFTYLGIPFAKPITSKEQRFKKAEPVGKWIGVYDATSKKPACVQGSQNDLPWVSTSKSSEDCLYLNIWVPDCILGNQRYKLPVMIYIHGGGFYSGSAVDDIYDGATLAATGDVIVASMNYRVASFGFFMSGTEDAPGNLGLLDQAMAIQWIKDNIEHFGGDPNSITLFGESAGSISVGMHTISPMTRNLFSKGILQSSGPYHPQTASNKMVGVGKSNIFATAVGCADENVNIFTDPEKVTDCMRNMDSNILSRAEGAIVQKLPYFFLPVYGDEFLPQSPIEALDTGNFRQMPLLMGSNKDEGAIFVHQLIPEYFGKEVAADLNKQQAQMMIFGIFQNNTRPPPNAVMEFYLRNTSDEDYETLRRRIYESFGDFVFVCPSIFFAEKFENVFYYLFTHRPSNTQMGKWMGTTHFEDVAFVFGSPLRNPGNYTKEEIDLSLSIMKKWTQFVKTGNPVAGKSNEFWPKFTRDNSQFRILDPVDKSVWKGLQEDECNFWRSHFTPES